jgi:hypothetical protein
VTRHDSDVIGTKPPVDLGPLFAQQSAAEAEATLQQLTHSDPAPAPRAKDETAAFDAPAPLTELERQARIDRVKAAIFAPLVALALTRKDLPHERAGVTAKDARAIAAEKGLSGLLGDQQRAWSWLSGWLQDLARQRHLQKYVVTGMTVKRMGDNGNEHVVYLHPYDYRAQEAA